MTNSEYEAKMHTIMTALRVFYELASVVTDDEMAHIEQTIERADSVGFLFVVPMDFPAAMERVRQQREILKFVREGRALVRKLRREANAAAGTLLFPEEDK